MKVNESEYKKCEATRNIESRQVFLESVLKYFEINEAILCCNEDNDRPFRCVRLQDTFCLSGLYNEGNFP